MRKRYRHPSKHLSRQSGEGSVTTLLMITGLVVMAFLLSQTDLWERNPLSVAEIKTEIKNSLVAPSTADDTEKVATTERIPYQFN